MWYFLDNNKFYMTRGDTAKFGCKLWRNKKTKIIYTPVSGDQIIFRLKQSASPDATVLLQKSIPLDTLVLEFAENDTKSLAFGTYKYEIEVRLASGVVDTVIKSTDFIIGEEL